MKINAPEALMAAEVTRRGLMKTTAIGGLAVASSAFTLPFTRLASAADALSPATSPEKVVWSACTVNCGSRCPLRMHVVDGEIKMSKPTIPGTITTKGYIRFVRVCVVAPCVAASIIRTA